MPNIRGFDPESGTFTNIKPILQIPPNTSASSYCYPTTIYGKPSLWSRFNNAVVSIGSWLAQHSDVSLSILSLLVIAGLVITGLVCIILAWINEGFWVALLTTLIVAFCGVIAWYIVVFALYFGLNLILYGLRFLFWNGWTMVIAILLALGLMTYNYVSNNFLSSTQITTTQTYPSSTIYRCTANVLNIRDSPSKRGQVIGILRKDETVTLYSITNGFAQIRHLGKTGYVCMDYLTRAN